MPSRSWPLWLLTALVLAGYPLVNFLYWPLMLRSGVLPIDADSIGIPIFSSMVVAVLASPFVLATAWFCLRRYNPATRIAAWRRDRPWRSAIATLLSGAAGAWVLAAIFADLSVAGRWFDPLWPAYGLCLLLWLAAMRAAVIDQRDAFDPALEASAW